jgi:hypothetical protein
MKARATSTQPRSNQADPAADFIDSIGQKGTRARRSDCPLGAMSGNYRRDHAAELAQRGLVFRRASGTTRVSMVMGRNALDAFG